MNSYEIMWFKSKFAELIIADSFHNINVLL